MKMRSKGLLDELTLKAGCLYMSDLHKPDKFEQIKKAVRAMEYGSYSGKEWKDAFEYIAGKMAEGSTEEEIRHLFEETDEPDFSE